MSTFLFNFILGVNVVPFVSNNIHFHILKGNRIYIEEKIIEPNIYIIKPYFHE